MYISWLLVFFTASYKNILELFYDCCFKYVWGIYSELFKTTNEIQGDLEKC